MFANKYNDFWNRNEACMSGCSTVDTRFFLKSNTTSNFLLLWVFTLCLHIAPPIHCKASAHHLRFVFVVSHSNFCKTKIKCVSRVLKVTLKTLWIEMMTMEWGIVGFEGADLWLVDGDKMTPMWQGIWMNWLVIGRGPVHLPGYTWTRLISCQT